VQGTGKGRAVRRVKSFALLFILVPVFVSVPTLPASAHGECGFDYNGVAKSSTWSGFYDSPREVRGYTRFHCRDYENHESMYVMVRLFRCVYGHGYGFGCSTPLNFIKGDSKTCGRGDGCILHVTINNPCSNSWYRYVAFGRWAAYNVDGVRVHSNPGWPDLNRELPDVGFTDKVGTYCG
jgi:hypothetical protein